MKMKIKMLAGGLLRSAVSSATKKFLKEGLKKFPPSILKEGLTKTQITQAHTSRKSKIAEFTFNKLNKLGANIFSGKIKNQTHFKRAEKLGTKIIKDQKKLQTMSDFMEHKGLIAKGKKTN
jgi:hypothetical protein